MHGFLSFWGFLCGDNVVLVCVLKLGFDLVDPGEPIDPAGQLDLSMLLL